MNKETIIAALKALDQKIGQAHKYVTIYAMGGGPLILLGKRNDCTRDFDLFRFPGQEVLDMASEVADEIGLDKKWLNHHSAVFVPNDIETGPLGVELGLKNIKIFIPTRREFLLLKLKAQMDRGFDLRDIMALEPTRRELEAIKLQFKESDRWHSFEVDETFREIFEQLDVLEANDD